MEEHLSFVPLLIVATLAFLVPLVLSRLKWLQLPVVVGEILAGIIVGDSGLKLVGHDPILSILSMLGFAYLMFLSGLEIDFGAILPKPSDWQGGWRERLGNPLSLGISSFFLTLLLALVASLVLLSAGAADDPWLMALILSTTSLGLVMPVLKERGLTAKPYGQVLLVAAVVADFVTMLLVSVYVVIKTEGLSLDVLLVLLLFGAFATVYRIASMARQRLPGLNLMQSISAVTSQLDVRGAFAIALAFIALAQGLGVEMILGAFLGGALISLLANRGASDLRHRLDVIGYSFFIPIFFIMVGVRFDLGALLDSPQALLLVPVLLGLAYGIKLIAALVLKSRFSWRETLAGGALLSSRLSLIIAISAIGLGLGVVDTATNSAIILVAIVTSTVSPLIFIRLSPPAAEGQRKFVIVGAGRLPRLLARRVAAHGQSVVVVDRDPARAAAVEEEKGLTFVQGDALHLDLWESLEPATIRAVAVLLPEDETNLDVCRVVQSELDVPRLISRVHDATQTQQFTKLGVQVINPSLSPVVELEYLLLYPSVSSLMTDLEDEHDISELRLRCAEFVGIPLRDLDLPEGASIVLVRRGSDVIYPRGHTVLQFDDRLTLMGSLEAVRDLARRCG